MYSSDEIYQKVIQAEDKLKAEKEKNKWYQRACDVGICPKCGGTVTSYESTIYHKCTMCTFKMIK